MRYRVLWFALGFLIALVPEILRVYLIMPFPGSQEGDTIGLAYFLNQSIIFFRIVGVLMMAITLYSFWRSGKRYQKIISIFFILLYGLIFYFFTFIAQADKMFIQPRHKIFLSAAENKVDEKNIVIGVDMNGESAAYPINIIGYHHQVQDSVGGTPVIITYCTVCRSGRAYSPIVNGHIEKFRLVGMDHFNAMIEDASTGSWWRQENGEAIAGPLKGKFLSEIPSQQVTLKQWITEHPQTKILQPDPDFAPAYAMLEGYDYGNLKNQLEYTDTGSWKMKSWVVGVTANHHEKAYDWNDLKKLKAINDTIAILPVLVVLNNDSISFHAFNRLVNGQVLFFEWNDSTQSLLDTSTHSVWNIAGNCLEGELKGSHLTALSAFEEYWHSWKQFHPKTTLYKRI